MSVTNGPRRGVMINALTGDLFDSDFRKFLRAIDALLFCSVINMSTSAPPGSPANGDAYIVNPSGSGAWAGHNNAIAIWTTDNPATPGGLWEFYAAAKGVIVYSVADVALYCWTGSAWSALAGGGGGSSTLAGDTDVVISSPSNNQVLTYESSSSKWKNKNATGGGGGGIPTGSNVVPLVPLTLTDNFSGFTIMFKIAGRAIVNLASSWQFSIWVVSGTFTADHSSILRTAIDDLTTVIDVTTVLWGGSAACSVGAGEQFCDAISLALDTAHDYWIAIHGTSATNLKTINTVPAAYAGSGYASGDQTSASSIPSVSGEVAISRIISA